MKADPYPDYRPSPEQAARIARHVELLAAGVGRVPPPPILANAILAVEPSLGARFDGRRQVLERAARVLVTRLVELPEEVIEGGQP